MGGGGAPADALQEFAPAKVNLTLRVVGRRADGYHLLHSLVVFADVGDRLTLTPGDELDLHVEGPTAAQAGPAEDNLVRKAARALAARVPALRTGTFRLRKELPAAAGIGGGSSDAAAALRLLAQANGLPLADPRLHAAAAATGADVPVCLDPRARFMSGIGEVLSPPVTLSALPAVLANARVAVPTRDVFRGLGLAPGGAQRSPPAPDRFASIDDLLVYVAGHTNDLENPAIALQPKVGATLAALRAQQGARLVRMSGSGATCFAVFESDEAATNAARDIRRTQPTWWVHAGVLS